MALIPLEQSEDKVADSAERTCNSCKFFIRYNSNYGECDKIIFDFISPSEEPQNGDISLKEMYGEEPISNIFVSKNFGCIKFSNHTLDLS